MKQDGIVLCVVWEELPVIGEEAILDLASIFYERLLAQTTESPIL